MCLALVCMVRGRFGCLLVVVVFRPFCWSFSAVVTLSGLRHGWRGAYYCVWGCVLVFCWSVCVGVTLGGFRLGWRGAYCVWGCVRVVAGILAELPLGAVAVAVA